MTNNTSVLGLFPGQGSQSVGMGHELVESSELAREMFEVADKALGFELSKICFQGPPEKLTETAITQPAILTVSSICYKLFKENPQSPTLCAAAGHSLGEYSALVAAGSLSFEDAVQLVHKRGAYMQEAVPVGAGKMVAVLGKEIEEIETAIEKTDGVAEVANFNAPGQIVVAGSAQGIDSFVACLENPKVKELPVSAPFHCSLMKPAEEKLAKDLEATSISPAHFPVYANYHAKPLTEPEAIREALRLQVCGRVRWVESMQAVIGDHAPTKGLEFGSGKVLSGLMRRIDRGLACQPIGSLTDIESFA